MARKWGADAHEINAYAHQTYEKIAKNSLDVWSWAFVTINAAWHIELATPGVPVEWVSQSAYVYPSDNETEERRGLIYQPAFWQNTYIVYVASGLADDSHVGKFYQIDVNHDIDLGTQSPSVGQLRIEKVIDGGKRVVVRIIPFTGLPAWAYQDKWIASIAPAATPGHFTVTLNDGSTFDADLSDLLDNTDSQKLILWPGPNEISITTKDGVTIYNSIDLAALVKNAETQTTLDSVEIAGNQLIVKYTGEDGNQQVKSVDATVFITDVNVQNAILQNPSAGVWNLIITETDWSTHTVNVSDLIKIITADTSSAKILGDGTPADPLRVNVQVSTQAGNGLVLLADGLYAWLTETITTIDEPSANSFRYTNEAGAQVIITIVKSVSVTGAGTTLTVTANGVAWSYDIVNLIKAGETNTPFTAITGWVQRITENGTSQQITFEDDYSDPNNPKCLVKLDGTTIKTILLNYNDIQINNAGSEWDLTDDQLTILETNWDSQVLSFAKYNRLAYLWNVTNTFAYWPWQTIPTKTLAGWQDWYIFDIPFSITAPWTASQNFLYEVFADELVEVISQNTEIDVYRYIDGADWTNQAMNPLSNKVTAPSQTSVNAFGIITGWQTKNFTKKIALQVEPWQALLIAWGSVNLYYPNYKVAYIPAY